MELLGWVLRRWSLEHILRWRERCEKPAISAWLWPGFLCSAALWEGKVVLSGESCRFRRPEPKLLEGPGKRRQEEVNRSDLLKWRTDQRAEEINSKCGKLKRLSLEAGSP